MSTSMTDRALFVVVALSCVGFMRCSAEPAAESSIRPVRTMEIFTGAGTRERAFSGVTRAGIEAVLSFRVPGTIIQLPIAVGRTVDEGQPIAVLDPADYRLQVQEAAAALAQSQANARNTRANYDRVRELYENENASLSELDAARAAAESGEASVSAAQTRLALARSQLSYTTLRAPLAGDIASITAEVNENVNTGQAIAVLNAGEIPEVEVAMPENLISGIKVGDDVTVTLDAIPGREFPATITEVGAAATGAGATFPVIVRFDAADPAVRPGMAASARFSFTATSVGDVVQVPPAAVTEDREGRYVYVVEQPEGGVGTIRRRSVRVGELTASGLTVLEGLEDGDLLVTAGVSRVRDGQQVQLLTASGIAE
jgi:RND family efflux transporter MFP subunit